MAPILEEILFRRLLIPYFEATGHISTPLAILISALMFGLIHTEADLINGSLFFAILHFTSASILGLGLGAVYAVTRDVKYPIFYHALNNGFSLLIQFITILNPIDENNIDLSSDWLIYSGLLILVMLLIGIILIILALTNTKKIKHMLFSQFSGNITKKSILTLILVIVAVQGLLFVMIPVIETLILDFGSWDIFSRLIINLIGPLFVFLISFIFVKRNIDTIKEMSMVENKPLVPYQDDPYSTYHTQSMFISPNLTAKPTEEISDHKFCRNCGAKLPEQPDLKFCPNCGFNLYQN